MKTCITLVSTVIVLALLATPHLMFGQVFEDSEQFDAGSTPEQGLFAEAPDVAVAPEDLASPESSPAPADVLDVFGDPVESPPEFAPQRDDLFSAPRPRQRASSRSIVSRPRGSNRHVSDRISAEDIAKVRKVRTLRARVRSERDESKRAAAASELKMLLADIFDADLKKRNAELEKLEARVRKLRSALDKREAARERVLNVQIDSLLLEAEGLDFPHIGSEQGRQASGQNPFTVHSVRRNADGSRTVRIQRTILRSEVRGRPVPSSDLVKLNPPTVQFPVAEVREVLVPRGKEVAEVINAINRGDLVDHQQPSEEALSDALSEATLPSLNPFDDALPAEVVPDDPFEGDSLFE